MYAETISQFRIKSYYNLSSSIEANKIYSCSDALRSELRFYLLLVFGYSNRAAVSAGLGKHASLTPQLSCSSNAPQQDLSLTAPLRIYTQNQYIIIFCSTDVF